MPQRIAVMWWLTVLSLVAAMIIGVVVTVSLTSPTTRLAALTLLLLN